MRLADLVCTFAVAADAGMGMPMDHALRAAALAARLGELARATDDECSDAYYLALTRYVGCTSDASLAAEVMGDESRRARRALRRRLGHTERARPALRPRGAEPQARGTRRSRRGAIAQAKSHVEAGDTIAIELNVRGTHTGSMMTPKGTVPGTRREVVWDSCDFIRTRNGRVVSWHVYHDTQPFMMALGLVPQPV